jgi:hypothetical protein
MAARLAVSKPQWHSSVTPTASIGMQRSIRPGRFLDGEVHHNVDQEWASRQISAIAEIRPRLLAHHVMVARPRPAPTMPKLTKARSQTYLLISFSSIMAQAEEPQPLAPVPYEDSDPGNAPCRHVDPRGGGGPPCIGSALSQPSVE